MNRSLLAPGLLLCALAGNALAQPTTNPTAGAPAPPPQTMVAPSNQPPAPAVIPAVGADFSLVGQAGFPAKLDWLYDSPSAADATGKIIVHWFCSAKPKAVGALCADELARMVTLKEANPRVYIIAYVDGSKTDAKKLDPIRESEGVGRGTVAYGKYVTKFMKTSKITSPLSVVVGVDGKVKLVTTSTIATDFDARDQAVADLASKIKEYDFSSDGPRIVKVGEKFQLSVAVHLAPWLKYTTKTPSSLKITVPGDIKCDSTNITGDQFKITGDTLSAAATCSGPRGSYEARAELSFGYEGPSGTATGLGQQSASWKFEIKP